MGKVQVISLVAVPVSTRGSAKSRGGRKTQGPAEFYSLIVFLGLMQATFVVGQYNKDGYRKAMNTSLSRDDFDRKQRNPEQANLEEFLQNYLQTHFGPTANRASDPLLATINLVERFASSVNTDQFPVGFTKLIGLQPPMGTATKLIGNLADVCSPSTQGIESHLLRKSLQEALLVSIDVQGDCTVVQFAYLLREFLWRHGTISLIRLFIGLHMFNTVWLELLESNDILLRSEEALGRLATALEETCFARVDSAIAAGLVGSC